MTNEELLKPRYKVIADWPRENKYDSLVGTIYTLPDLSKELSPISDQVIKNHLEDWCAYYNHYPHLFKPLQWWEERQREDLPDYVKVQLYFDATPSFVSMIDDKVEYSFIDNECQGIKWKKGGGTLPDYLQPATLEEYQSFNQNKVK